ncbi:MAG TPA: transglycosylase family protein [Candidatus Limnocylindrales bacterium]
MPDRRRPKAVIVTALAAVLLLGSAPSVFAHRPPGLERFLYALGQVESGGRYDALNEASGAYGKYQIMPTSWRAWADRYLGDANARQSPKNQEIVAHYKVTNLFRRFEAWRVVAHWWLTGSTSTNGSTWSSTSHQYVERVLNLFRLGIVRLVDDAVTKVQYTGRWRQARYHAYAHRRAHYATEAGATATFTFTGRSIAWVGPVGPTRGRAIVSINGREVAVVNLRRSSFDARVRLFSRHWSTTRERTISIRVAGSSGRPVAIDGFRVGK